MQESKIREFLDEIYRSAEQSATEKIKEINEKKSAEMAEIKSDADREADELYRREMQKASAAVSARYARTIAQLNADLFDRREKIRNEIFAEIERKIEKFTESDAYRTYLTRLANRANKALGSDARGAVIYLRDKDLRHSDTVCEAFGADCTVETDRDIIRGGITVCGGSKRIDESIDTKLDAEKEAFTRNSGLKVIQ